MRTSVAIVSMVLMACLFGVGAFAAEQNAAAPPAASCAAKVKPLSDPAGEAFIKSKEAFLKKDMKTAAEEIRKAAAVLKEEGTKATGKTQEALTTSAGELEKLAQGVEKETVKGEGELTSVFARAHHALAQHHIAQAREAHEKQATMLAAQHTQAAAMHTEKSAAAAKCAMSEESQKTITAAHAEACNHMQGTGGSKEDMHKHIEALSREISMLQEKLEKLKAEEAAAKK